MTRKSGARSFLESIPLLLVVLIPIGLIAYALWDANPPAPSTTATLSTATVSTTTQDAAISGTITLDNPSSLPTSAAEAELVPFSFTIQNTGASSEQLQYKVSVLWSTGEDDVIDENVASLAPGASAIVDEELKFEIATETAEVTLSLPQVGESSRFALPRAQ